VKGASGDADKALCKMLVDFIKQETQNTGLMLQRVSWPGIELSGEAKISDRHGAVKQLLAYTRALRRTQAWRYFTIGLVATSSHCGLLRADPLGVEQCLVPNASSHGVLELIRIALGITQSSGFDLGRHPAFTLRDVEVRSQPANLTPKAKETIKAFPTKLLSREAEFVTIQPQPKQPRQEDDHQHFTSSACPFAPATTYFVHHLMEDRGSLTGRSTRVFVVSREATPDPTTGRRQFVGPFALKMHYAIQKSSCFKHRIVERAAAGEELIHVLIPSRYVHQLRHEPFSNESFRMWYQGDVLRQVRHLTSAQIAEESTLSTVLKWNREEMFSESVLQPSLPDCADWGEFVQAIRGVFRGSISESFVVL
jgi:hypothetical protein